MAKKNHRLSAKGPTPQLRSRTTRSSKPRLLTDPTSSTQLLTTQLQSLGLYAAPTIGDGNCLFRALSDQVHGSPEKHREVRKQVCDWIEEHKERYEGFVEDDDYLVENVGGKAGKKGTSSARDKGKGLEAHLRCMRENATYGGHMELSAFAHLSKQNIKVIQPGLVYVIEWHAGESSSTSTISTSAPVSSSSTTTSTLQDQDPHPERRRSQRTYRPATSSPSKQPSNSNQDDSKQIVKIGTGKHGYYVYEEISDSEDDEDDHEVEASLTRDNESHDDEEERESGGETVYVAYHDWEHFSSIRNLRGPHAGLPHVRETPAQSVLVQREREREALKEREKEQEKERKERAKEKEREREREMKKTNVIKVKLKIPSTSPPQPISASTSLSSFSSCSSLTSIGTTTTSTTTVVNADPTMIPLPNSRSVSPFPPISSAAIQQSRIYPVVSNITDSTSTSFSTSASTSTSTLPTITIPTISPPIPATPTSATSTLSSININTIRSLNPHIHLHQHQHRSPKRTFDESSASGEDADSGSAESSGSGREKRSRVGPIGVGERSRLGAEFGGNVDADADNMDADADADIDVDTPGLSAPGSSSSEMNSDSDLTSPSPPPVESEKTAVMKKTGSPHSQSTTSPKSSTKDNLNSSKPLTRRQRKALGLPKPRLSLSDQPSCAGVGKIVIPGGKWKGYQNKGRGTVVSAVDVGGDGDGGDGEWRRNGNGRVDVRGFRELKI